jgi:hypothetical protein
MGARELMTEGLCHLVAGSTSPRSSHDLERAKRRPETRAITITQRKVAPRAEGAAPELNSSAKHTRRGCSASRTPLLPLYQTFRLSPALHGALLPLARSEGAPARMELPEAPTFRPSAADLAAPGGLLAYIHRVVRPAAEARFGLAKIVPPEAGAPVGGVIDAKARLPTTLLAVHQLQSRDSSASVKEWHSRYAGYVRAQGGRVKKPPMFAGEEVDLFRLHRAVAKRGGYSATNADRAWGDVAAALQVGRRASHGQRSDFLSAPRAHANPPPPPQPQLQDKNGGAAAALRGHYHKLLLPFDEHCAAHDGGGAPSEASGARAGREGAATASPGHLGGRSRRATPFPRTPAQVFARRPPLISVPRPSSLSLHHRRLRGHGRGPRRLPLARRRRH